jgi:polygalacturonase
MKLLKDAGLRSSPREFFLVSEFSFRAAGEGCFTRGLLDTCAEPYVAQTALITISYQRNDLEEDGENVYRTGRIKCGTESNGGFKNITISNCVFEGCNSLSLESEDGALCEDITISNISMRNLIYGPLFFRLGARLRGPKESTRVGTLRRILVSNIVSYNSAASIGNILSGVPGYPIEDIKIANFYMQHKGGVGAEQAKVVPPEQINKYPDPGMFGPMPAQGFFLRHLRNLELSHVEIAPMANDARPSFVLEDVTRADFFAITAPTEPPAFALRDAKDIRILFSRAATDAALDNAIDKMH